MVEIKTFEERKEELIKKGLEHGFITFEELAEADVANFLVNNLKYWDNFETVFSTIDLKMGNLENEAGKRDNVIEYLESNYVNAANKAIPLIMTV